MIYKVLSGRHDSSYSCGICAEVAGPLFTVKGIELISGSDGEIGAIFLPVDFFVGMMHRSASSNVGIWSSFVIGA